MYLEELHLYGSARLGILKKALALRYRDESGAVGLPAGSLLKTALAQSSYQQLELGRRRYELSNHLGNVLATVSDKSLGQDSSQTGQADYYLAQVSSASLYYPFGWEMPGRKFVSGEGYRFGFNGKEDDRDWGPQNIQDYGFRLYNPSIGKFLSVDPLSPDYPWYTPYQFAGNKPIQAIDLDGLEEHIVNTGDLQSPVSETNKYSNTFILNGPYSPEYINDVNDALTPYNGFATSDHSSLNNDVLQINSVHKHGSSDGFGGMKGGHSVWDPKDGRIYSFAYNSDDFEKSRWKVFSIGGSHVFPSKKFNVGEFWYEKSDEWYESHKRDMLTSFEIQVTGMQYLRLKNYYRKFNISIMYNNELPSMALLHKSNKLKTS